MHKFASCLFTFALLAVPAAYAQQTGDPSGLWLRGDGNARVKIAACGADICATNMWIGDTSGGEEPGDRLVMSLKPKSANTLTGTAYDAKRSRTYSMTMKIAPDRLVTRGCILGGALCKSVNWTRAN